MMSVRLVAWLLVVAAVALTARPFVTQLLHDGEEVRGISIGGPFAMTDHNGRSVTEREFAGRAMAIFPGFTYCPDVCPTTLSRMTSLMEKLGSEADKLQVFLVSVDPERDTPEVLKSYLAAFDPRFTGLTGTVNQLADFARKFRIYYEKVPIPEGGYSVNHSAGVYLFDKSGEFQGTLDADESDNVAVQKLKMLIAE